MRLNPTNRCGCPQPGRFIGFRRERTMLVAAPPGPERTRLRYSAWSLRLAVPWLLHVKTGESPCAFEEARRGCCFERSSPCNGSRCPYERQDGKSCFPLAEFLDNIARSIVLKTAGGRNYSGVAPESKVRGPEVILVTGVLL